MKFLLVDDHALFRQGLRLLLTRLPGTHEFIESATCEAALVEAGTHADIDLILLDLALPGMNGLDALARFRALRPATPIVLLSANESTAFIVEGMRRGAQGFIPKSASPEVVTAALQVILAGGTYVPAHGIVRQSTPWDRRKPLTGRQHEVLGLLTQNKSNKEIADALGMRVNTVRVHVAAILKALGVDNRTDAARVAIESGSRVDAG